MIPKDKFYDFGKQVFPEMVKRQESIFGYKMVEYWSDVGNLRQYHLANADAMQGRVRLRIPGKRVSSGTWLGKGSRINPTAVFEGSIILGNRADIGPDVKISGESVIGDMCIIDSGARLENSVVWADTYIGKNAVIKNSVIGAWCHIGPGVEIGKDSILSNRCHIRRDAKISSQSRIAPDTII
jgi:NDP-sugar pyrophosphorylase family protein